MLHDLLFRLRSLFRRDAVERELDDELRFHMEQQVETYVRTGLGVGIVAEMATRDEPAGSDLVVRPLGHLFGDNVSRVAFKRGAYLRSYVYTFAELLSERLTRALIVKAMSGSPDPEDTEL